ncbi:hypothetical protein BD414DRAFT_486289 [Trametes punicea]|nr:hypothetical protein BD414DRAFT_486289 [Trametes punicea]
METPGGLHVFNDSGRPQGHDDYTTVIVLHGYVWHAGIFSKLFPLAQSRGIRLISLNRREYPGATPYTAEERALLPPVLDKPPTNEGEIRSASEMLETFMRQRARELYECLQALVVERSIPRIRADSSAKGGIILVGWSLGATWMTALLSHVSSFPVNDVRLGEYIRRIVWYDPPACLLGYPYPETDPYNPFNDTSLTHEERGQAFTKWITSYFSHGDTLETFERRKPLTTPPSTLAAMSNEDFQATVHVPPGVPGGSDWTLLHGCLTYGTFGNLRKGALFLSPRSPQGAHRHFTVGDIWADVEVRYVWGDHSVWEVPYAASLLREEVDGAKADGEAIRPVTILRVNGANHFAQWDYPERVLEAFLAETADHLV